MDNFSKKMFVWFTMVLLLLGAVAGVFSISIAVQVGFFYVIQKLSPSWVVLSKTFSYLSLPYGILFF